MKRQYYSVIAATAVLLGAATPSSQAQKVNTWRGDAVNADWNEAYKWKLNHPPSEGEAAHFRGDNCMISVNSTVQLDNGMHLYGEELLLKGNGNINLWSPIPHERAVNIPASADGYATLTLQDNISVNGLIALSAKGFGTSASKGALTLKDRATVTGGLTIGNEGVGSGQVFVEDNATFRITSLEFNTKADQGGLSEIHILGGTVRIEAEKNLYDVLMADPGRRIVIGDTGTLRIESDLPISEKKALIKDLIANDRLVAAPGCRLTPPILQDEMMIARAEDSGFQAAAANRDDLLSEIDSISDTEPAISTAPSDLGDLVKSLHNEIKEAEETEQARKDRLAAEAAQGPESRQVAGYIVFFGAVMLAMRRPAPQE